MAGARSLPFEPRRFGCVFPGPGFDARQFAAARSTSKKSDRTASSGVSCWASASVRRWHAGERIASKQGASRSPTGGPVQRRRMATTITAANAPWVNRSKGRERRPGRARSDLRLRRSPVRGGTPACWGGRPGLLLNPGPGVPDVGGKARRPLRGTSLHHGACQETVLRSGRSRRGKPPAFLRFFHGAGAVRCFGDAHLRSTFGVRGSAPPAQKRKAPRGRDDLGGHPRSERGWSGRFRFGPSASSSIRSPCRPCRPCRGRRPRTSPRASASRRRAPRW